MAVQGIFEWMEAGGGTNLCKKEKQSVLYLVLFLIE